MRANQETATDPARHAAWRVLLAVTDGKMIATLSAERWLKILPVEVQARALRLADVTLRQGARADAIWQRHVPRPPRPAVAALLRLALVEIGALGAPAHAVVDAAVALAKSDAKTRKAAGMVNAVLRKSSASLPDWEGLPVPELPAALAEVLAAAWGVEALRGIERQMLQSPVALDLTARADAPTLAEVTGGRLMANGTVRLDGRTQVSTLPGYADGQFWVQDAAAEMPARLAASQPGERVLDLCAAPGGKTMQLAATGAEVTAVDLSPSRTRVLRANLERTGLTARVITSDATEITDGPYDCILLDAPCSATGTLRRHPDLPVLFAARDLERLIALQARLLDHALTLLRPGGRLIYCTCSLLPEEGESQIERLLARNPSVAIVPPLSTLQALLPVRDPRFLRSLPCDWSDQGGIDGFFIAQLTLG